jgi:hypothetical protein
MKHNGANCPRNCAYAYAVRCALGHKYLPDVIGVPHGPRADMPGGKEDNIYQGYICEFAVDNKLQPFAVFQYAVGVAAGAHGVSACRKARGGSFHHGGEGVVCAGGYGHQRYRTAALGHRAICAVAAQGYDAPDAKFLHHFSCYNGVAFHLHVVKFQRSKGDLRYGLPIRPVHTGNGLGNNIVIFRHIVDLPDAGGMQRHYDTADDVDLFLVVVWGAVCHDAADILAGCRIRDNSY